MKRSSSRDGFALMAALWLVVMIGLAGYELSTRGHATRLAATGVIEASQVRAAAMAGLETARERLDRLGGRPLADISTALVDSFALGQEEVIVSAYDAGSRLQLNLATEEELQRLIASLGVDARSASRLAQRIMDWRDGDDTPRSQGAERDDYLRIGARLLPANRPFDRVKDLLNVDGMTPQLYARVAPLLTIHGTGQVNANAAPRAVLASLPGLGLEAIEAIVSGRVSGRPIQSLGELMTRVSPDAARGIGDAMGTLDRQLIFATNQLVIVSEGRLRGSPLRAGLEVVMQRTGDSFIELAHRRVDP
jgi:general secretion pathway protein K